MTKQLLDIFSQRENIKADSNCYQGEVIEHKKKIIEYFATVKPQLFTTMRVKDMVMNKEIESACNSRYFDGSFFWSEADIYHFVRYNMPLKQRFIDYVLSKN